MSFCFPCGTQLGKSPSSRKGPSCKCTSHLDWLFFFFKFPFHQEEEIKSLYQCFSLTITCPCPVTQLMWDMREKVHLVLLFLFVLPLFLYRFPGAEGGCRKPIPATPRTRRQVMAGPRVRGKRLAPEGSLESSIQTPGLTERTRCRRGGEDANCSGKKPKALGKRMMPRFSPLLKTLKLQRKHQLRRGRSPEEGGNSMRCHFGNDFEGCLGNWWRKKLWLLSKINMALCSADN